MEASAVFPRTIFLSVADYIKSMQTRQKKAAVVALLVEKIRASKAVVYAQYQGVTVKSLTEMRRELAKSGSSWQVMKKTLLGIALKEAGVEGNVRELPGQVGVAFSSDEVAAAKVLAEFEYAHPAQRSYT